MQPSQLVLRPIDDLGRALACPGLGAFNWFLGDNDLKVALYDAATGGCRDGLHPDRANENQGAESTLSFLMALSEMRRVRKQFNRQKLQSLAGIGSIRAFLAVRSTFECPIAATVTLNYDFDRRHRRLHRITSSSASRQSNSVQQRLALPDQ